MKALLITVIIMVAMAMAASAQVPSKPFNVYAGGGVTMPNQPSDFKDGYKTGYHGFIGLGLNVSPFVQMVGKVGYHSLSPDADAFDLANVDGGTFSILSYGVDARMALGAPAMPIKPFGFVGMGMANLNRGEVTSDSEPIVEGTASKFYYNFGAGFEFNRGPGLTFFLQAAYMSVAGDTEVGVVGGGNNNRIVVIPISLGVKF